MGTRGSVGRWRSARSLILSGAIWDKVNAHLGTQARSFPELIEQLGILRFAHRPRIGDTFCGGGSIPFEAARLGCDVYASDLSPIARMLTWGALNMIGADLTTRSEVERAQRDAAAAVDREISSLRVENDSNGNRAKAFLYCLEVQCPITKWRVPLSPTWVISTKQNVIARLVPDNTSKRFRIDIVTNATTAQVEAAKVGTLQSGELAYTLDGEVYRTPIKTIRGDYRLQDGSTGNNLRRWEKKDFIPRPEDIFQERLYCIQWITKETLDNRRQATFFAAVTEEDLVRERKVEEIVRENLAVWQNEGSIPDMAIESGDKTDEPIRTRGWTYWHHLFAPRQLFLLSTIKRKQVSSEYSFLKFTNELNFHSKLCGIHPRTAGSGREMCLDRVFINRALNTLANY